MLIDRIDNDLRIAATGTSGGSSTSAVSFRNTDSGIQSGQLTAPSTETWSWTQVGEEDTGAGGHVVEFNEPICITLITISFSAGVDLGTDVPIPVNDLPGTVQFRYYLNDVFLTYTDVPRTMRRGACSATPCSPAAAGSLSSSRPPAPTRSPISPGCGPP